MSSRFASRWPGPLLLGLVPVLSFARGTTHTAQGRETPDLLGHLWTIWHAAREPLTRTGLLSWPEGVDLLPILGGWLDIVIAAAAVPALGVVGGWNLAMASYLLLAGLGGWALSRELGAGPWAAALGGLVLQLDPATLHHLASGRGEQVGIGMLALFLAAGLRTLARPGWQAPAAAALTGALSLLVAWEYGVFIAILGLALFAAAGDRAARLRVLLAGAGAGLLALPAVLPFVLRSMVAPPGRFAGDWVMRAARNALVPFGPRGWGGLLPTVTAMAALLAMPLTARALPRRLRGVLLAVLLVLLAAAFGPEPHLREAPAGEARAWAPFTWLHALPLLSKYQTPARLLAPWSLLAAGATALAVQAAARWRAWLGPALAVGILGGVLFEVSGLLPTPGYQLPRFEGLERIAQDPHPGAVYDLPSASRGGRSIDKQLAQLVHERPIRHHSLQVYLEGGEPPPVDPFLTFTLGRDRGGEEQQRRGQLALQSLQDRGFGWVVLYAGHQRPSHEDRMAHRVSSLLGAPADQGRRWRAWRVPMDGGTR